jgi:hypothetical protein
MPERNTTPFSSKSRPSHSSGQDRDKIRQRFTDCRLVAALRQAQIAHAWTALQLPGGDIFLDLLSTDI